MEWMTIGAFARASGLTPKALRLYDGLGLLCPARVDPVSGYRFYAPGQLERARLVAWLRRIGMPLARVRQVCALEGAAAAREVRDFWVGMEAETAGRRDLAALLVDHLAPDAAGSGLPVLGVRCAGSSDAGRVRDGNQDAVYAGSRLVAVADGFGADGGPASAAAVEALKALESAVATADGPEDLADGGPASGPGGPGGPGWLFDGLRDAVGPVRRAVGRAARDPRSGTTLTALLWTGSRLALVHIGDSRAYLLRDGGLSRITEDHTLVQLMVDTGRLTPREAAGHPQRTLLVRAFGDGVSSSADTRLREARSGDRYLVCSDGLSSVVAARDIRRVLVTTEDPNAAVGELIALANHRGGPDNVSCAIADLSPAGAA